MCCRFLMEESPELRPYIEAAGRAPLTAAMVSKLARPLITAGEVRPTNIAVTLAPGKNGAVQAFPMVWGFTNSQSRSPVVNCRVETACEKPMWKSSWQSHRCVIPASCYFEWEHLVNRDTGQKKTGRKYMIQPKGCSVTYLAGLYRIEEMKGIRVPVFTVLTREPCGEVRSIHDRMPVMLAQEMIADWIRPDGRPEEVIKNALTDVVMSAAEAAY